MPTSAETRAAAMEANGLTPDDAAVVLKLLRDTSSADARLIGAALTLYDHLAPDLHGALARAADGGADTAEAEALAFWAVHLIAACRDTASFANLLRLLALPDEKLDPILGDALTLSGAKLIAGMFDGDVVLLLSFLENPAASPFARWAAFDALTFLTLDQHIERAATEAFLERYYAVRAFPVGDPAWYPWAMASARLGLTGLEDAVQSAFAEGDIDPDLADIGVWDETLTLARHRQHGTPGLAGHPPGYIEDLYEELKWLGNRQDVNDDDHDNPAPEPIRYAQPKTGRNEPCPCGSGKKFKKCCMNLESG